MFFSIGANISEPTGFAFRHNTMSKEECLLIGIIVAMNYYWEQRQVIDFLREGNAPAGTLNSKKEQIIRRNQLKIQDCIKNDRNYASNMLAQLTANITLNEFNKEKDLKKKKNTDRIYHKADSNPPEIQSQREYLKLILNLYNMYQLLILLILKLQYLKYFILFSFTDIALSNKKKKKDSIDKEAEQSSKEAMENFNGASSSSKSSV